MQPAELLYDFDGEELESVVYQELHQHNMAATRGLLEQPGLDVSLAVCAQDGQLVGGILCNTYCYCLYVDLLWVHEAYRGAGWGGKLLAEAERLAKERGCLFAHTSTFSTEAPGFYLRQGYTEFGRLDDYPDGLVEYFFKKKL